MINVTGTAAPHITIKDSSGIVHTLEEFKGSWLLLVFHRHLG